MAKPYESGSVKKVIRLAAEYAIRDQEALLDAIKHVIEYKDEVDEIRMLIRDLERLKTTYGE